jgi:polyisoprenoid-binding protein YceI
MKNRRPLVIIVALVALVAIVGIIYAVATLVTYANTTSARTGTPAITSQFGDIKTKVKSPTPSDGAFRADDVVLVAYTYPPVAMPLPQQALYESCTVVRGETATPTMNSAATPAGTIEPTVEVTTEANTTSAEPDFIVMQVVGDESEACYQVGEVFFREGNRFNMAVGVTQAINGEVAVDRANLANSKIGEIAIDISQFRSDDSMRDGAIRRNWLETNTYPIAKLTNAHPEGLPARAYQDGEVVTFKIVGDLTVREITKEVTFDAQASLTGDTLVVTASTNILMSDFGANPPDMAGMLRANDETRIVLNLVLREPTQ